jgi:hypothetical protein
VPARTSTEVGLCRRRRYAPRGCQVKRSVSVDDQPPEASCAATITSASRGDGKGFKDEEVQPWIRSLEREREQL